MGKRLTPESKEQLAKEIQERLTRNPNLTKSHFQTYCGISMYTLNKLEQEYKIIFGKSEGGKAVWRNFSLSYKPK